VTPGLDSESFPAIGTTAVVVAEGSRIGLAVREVRRELEDVDRTCSRFRADSDLSRVNEAGGGWVPVDDLLIEALEVALRAARFTEGLVTPTIGGAMIRLGYDVDFRAIVPDPSPLPARIPAPGWSMVEVNRDRAEVRVPPGVRLDLGSTGKALAADRAAARAAAATASGVLVSLGGDVAAAGDGPEDGWPVGIGDDHAAAPEPGETISIAGGGVATSSTTVRRWSRGGVPVHHLVDPRTGLPAPEVWRTVSVHAASCVDANIAATAAIVLGAAAPGWLLRQRLPSRLVGRDGSVLRLAGWPDRVAA
jgi:thiamine biosynthesis lipoprotein